MARPSMIQSVEKLQTLQPLPAEIVEYKRLFYGNPPKGLSLGPSTTIAREFTASLSNLIIENGVYSSPPGMTSLGDAATDDVQAFMTFRTTDVNFGVRFTRTGVDIAQTLLIPVWTPLTGPTLTGGEFDYFDWSGWGNNLLFTNGVDGLFYIDFAAMTYTRIPDAPTSKFVTTFSKRVILSGIINQENRIAWSVNGNFNDWTGLGSGAEDFLATPGGFVAEVMGVHPYADKEAWIIRRDSVWVMRDTDSFDQPFLFDRRFEGLGTESPYSAVMGAGLWMLSTTGVVNITPEGFNHVSPQIDDYILNEGLKRSYAVGAWDGRRRVYCLIIPEAYDEVASSMYRYHAQYDAWTKVEYLFAVRRITAASYLGGLTYDQLIGTYDEQVGPYDEWGVFLRDSGLFFAARSHRKVIRETVVGTSNIDVNANPIGWAVYYTFPIHSSSPINWVDINELGMLYYLHTDDAEMSIELSRDGGLTWSTVFDGLVVPKTMNSRLTGAKRYKWLPSPVSASSAGLTARMRIELTANSQMSVSAFSASVAESPPAGR